MNSDQVGGIVRTFLAWAAGFLPSTVLAPDLKTQIIGGVAATLVAFWSWYSKVKSTF
jgi:hypothetical protein